MEIYQGLEESNIRDISNPTFSKKKPLHCHPITSQPPNFSSNNLPSGMPSTSSKGSSHGKSKRSLEDVVSTSASERRKKKRKSHKSIDPMGQLQTGLDYIVNDDATSSTAKNHALELQKLLFDSGILSNASGAVPSTLRPSMINSSTPTPKDSNSTMTNSGTPTPNDSNSTIRISHYQEDPSYVSAGTPPLPPITNVNLLEAPFTHSSVLPTSVTQTSTNTYEPLEFLGDAYLEIIATRLIHSRFPNHTVGQKAGLREILVRNETLAGYARSYEFPDRVRYSGSEKHTSPKTWTKILADVFEAYVACIILSDAENGFAVTERWLTKLWTPKILEWTTAGDGKTSGVQEMVDLDIKSQLRRSVVSKGIKLEYLEEKPMEFDKKGNRNTFFMTVHLTGWGYDRQKLGSGCGRNKQVASAEAAKDAFITGKKFVDDAHKQKLIYDQVNRRTD